MGSINININPNLNEPLILTLTSGEAQNSPLSSSFLLVISGLDTTL